MINNRSKAVTEKELFSPDSSNVINPIMSVPAQNQKIHQILTSAG